MAYRRIFSTPHVLSLAAASVVSRLPVGLPLTLALGRRGDARAAVQQA
ncbi:MAG TPA: hypothetical protein VFX44_11535 [Solirubrobacterales bacterium]|nr:hypothetical protein [Solirubrobacterales bacterium]